MILELAMSAGFVIIVYIFVMILLKMWDNEDIR